jgi:ABC-type amino acid transport substrate-binding protein
VTASAASATLFLAACTKAGQPSSGVPGLLQQIEAKHRIDAGYGVYPPYTQEDPNTRKVSGFSVDVVEAIGVELGVPVVWHRLNWNTMAADLKRGEFDLIADPIFQTIPRAREFEFTEPYSVFADGIAVVRVGDRRFMKYSDIDRKGIVVAVGQGWASETIARNSLKAATIKSVQTTTDLLQVFNEVTSGRADVALSDVADATRFVKEHPAEVQAMFLADPPARIPAGFALRPGDLSGAAFLDASLRYLGAVGSLRKLADKYAIQIPASSP